MDAEGQADRARALILLRATLSTVADRLDQDSLEDLGLLTRMTELSDLVDHDLQQLANTRKTRADDSD
jgi:predicted component of type VI protein secretion system